MEFPDWLVQTLQESKQVIAFINPVDYNDQNISVIKNRVIDAVGNASQVYIYLEFRAAENIEQNRVVFARPKDINHEYDTTAGKEV